MVKSLKNKKQTKKEEIVETPVEEIEEVEEDVKSESDQEINPKSRVSKLGKNIEALAGNTGVIYIGHLPWGLDEKGKKKYFSQFGQITRILVPKSKKVIFFLNFRPEEQKDMDSSNMKTKKLHKLLRKQ
jgi:nucleolar protein 15